MLYRLKNLLAQFVVALSQSKNPIAQFAVVLFNFGFLVAKFVIVLFYFRKSFAELALRLVDCFLSAQLCHVVCTLKALKPLKKQKTFRPRETYRIKWESLADKEVRTACPDNIASKFKELLISTKDIETEWCLFRIALITSTTNCCGRKRVGGTKSSEKRTPWSNQGVKEAVRAKKSGLACK